MQKNRTLSCLSLTKMDSSLHLVPGCYKLPTAPGGSLRKDGPGWEKAENTVNSPRPQAYLHVCVCVCVLCRLHICTCVFQCVVCTIKNLTKVLIIIIIDKGLNYVRTLLFYINTNLTAVTDNTLTVCSF